MTLVLGFGFLIIFFRKFGGDNLKIGNDFIEIPGRWKNRVILQFDDIFDIGELHTYDNVIEIDSTKGIYLIERNWMKEKDFENVKIKLKEYWLKK